MQEPPHEPAQRAADHDRDAAADTIRAAGGDGRLSVEEMESRLSAVLAARTHPEIDLVLADLRGQQAMVTQDHGHSRPGAVPSGVPETTRTLTIMGDNARRGRWRPAARCRVTTVMGGSTVDLTEADLSRPVTHLRVFTLMGTTRIEVPDDVNVHVAKTTVLGQNDVDLSGSPLPGAPELHIHLISVMGEARLRCRRRPAPGA